MITGYQAYCLFSAMKLHFTSKSYDIMKYEGRAKSINQNAFEKSRDKYKFVKLSRKFSNTNDLILFLVSNFLQKPKLWIGDLFDENAVVNYDSRKKVHESMFYTFKNDCSKIFSDISVENALKTNGEYPILLTKMLQGDVSIETVIILNNILNFIPDWSKKIQDTIQWPEILLTLSKYATFVEVDVSKYKLEFRKLTNTDDQKDLS